MAAPLVEYEAKPKDIKTWMTMYMNDSGELVNSWKIKQSGIRTISAGAIGGAVSGLAIGAIIGAATKGKAKSPQAIMRNAMIIGSAGGVVIGGSIGSIIHRRRVEKVRKIEITTAGWDEKVMNLVNAYFHQYFSQGENLICPLSKEMFTLPVTLSTCDCEQKQRYDLSSIRKWIKGVDTPLKCGGCERTFQSRDIRICQETFEKVNKVIRGALDHLSEAMKEKGEIKDLEEIDEFPPDTIDCMIQGEISPNAAAILRRYLLPGVEFYNNIIKQVYENTYQELEEMLKKDAIDEDKLREETERLRKWKKAFIFKVRST